MQKNMLFAVKIKNATLGALSSLCWIEIGSSLKWCEKHTVDIMKFQVVLTWWYPSFTSRPAMTADSSRFFSGQRLPQLVLNENFIHYSKVHRRCGTRHNSTTWQGDRALVRPSYQSAHIPTWKDKPRHKKNIHFLILIWTGISNTFALISDEINISPLIECAVIFSPSHQIAMGLRPR